MNPQPDGASGLAGLDTLVRLQAEFAATVPLVDPRTPVPWCGEWRVHDLVVHLAQVHHWAAGQAVRRTTTPVPVDDDLVTTYVRCADELVTTLAATPPDAPAWTLDATARALFWHRRQVHETLVHLWDLRTAGDRELVEPPQLWADTVDEVLQVMLPRQLRLGRTTAPPEPVALVATDTDASWTLPALLEGPARATVQGPAAALGLLLWARVGPDDPGIRVTGDPEALRAALDRPLTP